MKQFVQNRINGFRQRHQKSIKIEGFPTSQKAGNPLFYCKNDSNGSKPVKNRALLVWEKRSTSKMNTQPN